MLRLGHTLAVLFGRRHLLLVSLPCLWSRSGRFGGTERGAWGWAAQAALAPVRASQDGELTRYPTCLFPLQSPKTRLLRSRLLFAMAQRASRLVSPSVLAIGISPSRRRREFGDKPRAAVVTWADPAFLRPRANLRHPLSSLGRADPARISIAQMFTSRKTTRSSCSTTRIWTGLSFPSAVPFLLTCS